MRQITLDTETTGLDPERGDRIIEIAAVEMEDGLKTGRSYHQLINPMRPIGADSTRIHGLTNADVDGKPVFEAITAEFLAFIGDAPLVIHNAAFDTKFLNHELGLAGLPPLNKDRIIDTLEMARNTFPGSPIGLDALCRRFNISLTDRRVHGALVDSMLLAEVYLNLTGGRQRTFDLLSSGPSVEQAPVVATSGPRTYSRFSVPDILAENHVTFLAKTFQKTDKVTGLVQDSSVWHRLANAESSAT